MHITILSLLLLIIILLIILLRGRSGSQKGGAGKKKGPTQKKNKKEPEKVTFCLLCGEELKKGVPMRSSLYPSDGREGRVMEMHGCDACIPPEGKRLRKCPVCGRKLKPNHSVIARRYETPGKNRVDVLGCPACYRPLSG